MNGNFKDVQYHSANKNQTVIRDLTGICNLSYRLTLLY